tara:strand:+ start:7502 stop:7924 length:423 start_codon:yes stop_codon:yes gene_type:complete
MEFKFSSAIFKNDPADNKNNNPNFPTHGGILKMPLSQLEEFVQYLHWAARTELQSDMYMNDKIIPVKISGWTKDSNGKKFLSLSFEPHYKTNMAAQEAKEAQAIAAHSETLQEQQPAQTTDTAAASLAQGTAGTVVEDFF